MQEGLLSGVMKNMVLKLFVTNFGWANTLP